MTVILILLVVVSLVYARPVSQAPTFTPSFTPSANPSSAPSLSPSKAPIVGGKEINLAFQLDVYPSGASAECIRIEDDRYRYNCSNLTQAFQEIYQSAAVFDKAYLVYNVLIHMDQNDPYTLGCDLGLDIAQAIGRSVNNAILISIDGKASFGGKARISCNSGKSVFYMDMDYPLLNLSLFNLEFVSSGYIEQSVIHFQTASSVFTVSNSFMMDNITMNDWSDVSHKSFAALYVKANFVFIRNSYFGEFVHENVTFLIINPISGGYIENSTFVSMRLLNILMIGEFISETILQTPSFSPSSTPSIAPTSHPTIFTSKTASFIKPDSLSGNTQQLFREFFTENIFEIRSSVFSKLESAFDGGAVLIQSSALISNSTFSNCKSLYGNGGAVASYKNSWNIYIIESHFNFNEAAFRGGALYLEVEYEGNYAFSYYFRSRVSASTFVSNKASKGGGIFFSSNYNDFLFEYLLMDFNQASESGGGIYANRSYVSLTFCSFTQNMASRGGGMFITDSTMGRVRQENKIFYFIFVPIYRIFYPKVPFSSRFIRIK
jgi:hypothetical protein